MIEKGKRKMEGSRNFFSFFFFLRERQKIQKSNGDGAREIGKEIDGIKGFEFSGKL